MFANLRLSLVQLNVLTFSSIIQFGCSSKIYHFRKDGNNCRNGFEENWVLHTLEEEERPDIWKGHCKNSVTLNRKRVVIKRREVGFFIFLDNGFFLPNVLTEIK